MLYHSKKVILCYTIKDYQKNILLCDTIKDYAKYKIIVK